MRNHMGSKGVEGLLLVGHEKVPLDFGLRTGDHGSSDTADGAGDCGRPASQARITRRNRKSSQAMDFYFFFLRYSTTGWPDWAKGRRKDYVCLCVF